MYLGVGVRIFRACGIHVIGVGIRIIASLCEGGGSYGGIAAEIGAKNMPPACFFNAPTEGENKNLKFSPPVSLALDSPLTEGAFLLAPSQARKLFNHLLYAK